MASANWMKATRQGAGAMKKHLNQEDRVKGGHANKDINPELTHLNYTLDCKDYMETLRRLTARTKAVDKLQPPKRDFGQRRITSCFIELPCPDVIRQQGRSDDFFVKMYQQLQDFFGKENVHGGYVHKDEVHIYYDKDDTPVLSLEHMHVVVSTYTPEKGINGKAFETKARLSALNKALDQTCLREFGVPLNTGETPQHKTVERLKEETELRQVASELRHEIQQLAAQADTLRHTVVQLQAAEKEAASSRPSLAMHMKAIAAEQKVQDLTAALTKERRRSAQMEADAGELDHTLEDLRHIIPEGLRPLVDKARAILATWLHRSDRDKGQNREQTRQWSR